MQHIAAGEGGKHIRRRAAGRGRPDIRGIYVASLACEIVCHDLQPLRGDVGLQRGLDGRDGSSFGGIGDLREASAQDADGRAVGGDGVGGNVVALCVGRCGGDARGDEAHADGSVWRAVAVVFACDGEVE